MPKLLSPEEFDAQFGGGYLAEAPRAGLGTRFGASLDRAQAGLYGVGEAVGLPFGDLRRENQAESEASMRRYFRDNPDEPQSFRDIDGIGSGLRYVRGLAIDSAPELAASLAALPAGAAMGLGTLGRLGLGAAFNTPSALGDILQNQREESGRTNLATAIPLTAPYVAADMLGIEGALARGRMLRTGLKGLDEMQGLKGAAARTAANAGLNFVAEGTGETLQEGVNQLGRMSVNRDQTLFNPEANDRYLESFVGGGLLGAGVSSTLGGWRRTPDYEAPPARGDLGYQPGRPGQQSVPQFNLLTNPEPLQERIDQNLGINRRPQKDYAAQFEAAFNEPSGVRVPDAQTGLERELTTGELYQLNMGEQGGQSVANTQQVGNTPTNQAQLAAQDALAPQQEAAQRQQEVQQQLQGTAQSLGITPAANISNAWDVLGARVYGQEQVANLVAGVNALQQAKDPEQQQIDAAVLKSNLVNLGGTTNVPSPQKIVNAIAGRLKAFQLEGVSSVARAAEIVNDQIGGLVAAGKNEGDVKLGQLATLYTNLTGQEPPAIKGKSNVSTPSAPAGQPAPASAGRSPDAAGSVVNPGPVPVVNEPVRGDAGGAQPAGGQAPAVANATIQRAPAVTTPQVGGAPAPQTEARTTLAVNPSNPFEVLTDEDENALEIAKMTGQEGLAQTIEDEQSGQRVDAEEMAAPEIEALLERRFADSDDPARDRRIFDAFMTATKYAPYGSVGAVKKAVGADFGVGNKLVDKIGNPEELVRVGKQMGFTEQQIEQAFGLDRKRKGKKGVDEEAYAPTDEEPTPSDEELASNDEEAPLTGPRTLGEFIDPDENAGLASDDGPVAADNDMAAALVAQGLDGSSAGLDDSRYWQKASSSGNQAAVPIFQRDATVRGLRESITQLEAQGLPNAVAQLRTMLEAEQAKLDELLAKLEKPAPAAPKREVAPDLAAAKQKFKSVDRDVTKMEPEELRMLRGEAERFQNTELVKQIDAQLTKAPAVEETAALAPAAEAPATEPRKALAVEPDRILTAQEKYEAAVAGVPGAPAFDDLPSKAKDRITDLANRDTLDLAAINRIVGEGAKFGKTSTGSGAVDNHYTAAELLSEIKNFVRADIPGRKLFIVDTIGDLLRHSDGKVRAVGAAIALQGAYGVAADGRAFLIADRIAKGRGRAKFMHEVGAHLGLENLLPKALYDKLTQQIIDWAKKEDGSTESELALNAVERVQNAGTPKEDRRKELLAYFIEEAMQAGIDPTASVKESGPLRDWFRTLWAAFKIAVRKLGFKPETMDAQDVVNLAFGAARLEIAGTFHGTAAAFRNFRNKFIGSGEGATAFGWGTYLAQRAGIAKGYWSADVDRKSSLEFDGVPIMQAYRAAMRSTEPAEGGAKYDALRQVVKALRDRSIKKDHVYFAHLELERLADGANPDDSSAQALKWFEENIGLFKERKPDGALMRVDVAVDNNKVLDYDKPVIKQPNFVANKLMELLDPVADDVVDMTNKDVEELTGKDLIGTGEQDLGLLSRLIMEDALSLPPGQDPQFDEAVRQGKFHEAASHFLRANGLDGIKFFDAKSRGTAVQAISFDGRSYNRDDLRDKVREYRNSDPDKAMQFLVLGDVLRNGLDTVMAELEAKVAKQADSFAQVYADSAARYNVKADVAADRARARQEAEDTYSGKQLAWLKANQGDISIAETPRTRNLVVFDDQNVFRVGSAVKADKQRMKFGVESPAKGLVEKNVSKLPPQAQKPVRASLATLQDYASKGLDRVVFTGDLVARAVEAGLKSAGTFRDSLVARETRARELEREVERIADMYALVPKAEQGDGPGSVNQFLFDSTRLGKWGYGKFADGEMAERFDKLDEKSQAFIKAVFAHGDKMLALKKKTVLDATDSEYDARIADAKARGDAKEQASLENEKKATIKKFQRLFSLREGKPYAPIKRTGNYVVVAKSSTYRDAEANKDTELLRKLEQDADHYNVTFTDTKGEARALSERLRETGVFGTEPQAVDFFEREDLAKRFSGDSMLNALTKLRSAADARAAAKEPGAARLQTMVSELYLEALAEGSARKSEMRRRGIAGEVDMLRSFAQQGRADSQFLASVQYNGQIQDSIQAMRKEADQFGNRARKTELFNELTNRYQQVLEQKSNPWLDKLTRLSSVWFLATSPGYYMQNLTQPWMMSVPMMAGRFDYTKVTGELVKAYGELKGVLTSGKAFKQSFDLTKVPGDVRDMVQKLVNEGKIDIGLESEMGEFQVEGRGAVRDRVNKIDRGLRLAVQKVETINRLSTAIAALRLEKAGGASDAKALEYAAKVLDNTHGDYTAMNAPRFFNTQVGKVALQFRKFQLIQLSYYAKLINDAATNPAERKAAFKTLGYMLGHTVLLAGVRGLPGFAAAAWVLGHLLGDDDEKFDFEGSIRKAIGDSDYANLVMRGAPTLLGADISGKVGSGNMLSILPFSDADLSTTSGRAEAFGTLIGGASLGLVSRLADGAGLMLSGDWYRGLETMAPKGIGDFAKALREANTGMTRRNGDVLLSPDEISLWETTMQALGVQPVQKAVTYERQQRVKDMDQNFQDRSKAIKNEFVAATRSGDGEARQEAREAWNKLQEARVRNGYTRQPLSELLRAPQQAAKRQRDTIDGVQANKQNRRFVEQMI